MKNLVGILVGLVGAIAFLLAGASIFVWDLRMLQKVSASRDWPHAQGQILRSNIVFHRTRGGNAPEPDVEYEYSVNNQRFTSHQISFDVFDNPGGDGLVNSIVQRYPPRKTVTVYYDPDEPASAILEPGIYSPFLMPLVFAIIFVTAGAAGIVTCGIGIWRTVHGLPAATQPRKFTRRRLIVAWVAATALIYATLVLSSFNPGSREVFVKVFGDRPLGMPNALFIVALMTVIFLPAPWIFWHLMRIQAQRMADGKWTTIDESLTERDERLDTRRSVWILVGGLVFYAALMAIWIFLTGRRGV